MTRRAWLAPVSASLLCLACGARTELPAPEAPPPDLRAMRCVLSGGTNVSDTWLFESGRWTRATPSSELPVSFGSTYGTLDGTVVVILGAADDGAPHLGETWIWDGSTWRQLHPAHASGAYAQAAMSVVGDALVLFGGSGEQGPDLYSDHTWTWNGADWKFETTSFSPGARWGAVAATVDHRLVLFGGSTPKGLADDTWTWDGARWVKLPTDTTPTARELASAGTVNGKMVMFGGCEMEGVACRPLGDTWTFDGSAWTELALPNAPTQRMAAAAATIPAGLIVFGGLGGADPAKPHELSDTWLFDGTRWTHLADGPPARASAILGCY